MLESFSEIQGVGLLHDANGKSHRCKKATLIYAENGRGKTTLAAVLRSLAKGDATFLQRQKTLDGKLPTKVLLQFGSGHRVTWENGAWSEHRPEFLVFDSDFVDRNVYSGSSVSTNHRKNLLEFALGEAAVAARTAVEAATVAATEAGAKVQEVVLQLSGYHAEIELAVFEKLPKVEDVDIQIAGLQKRITDAGNVAAIIAKPLPAVVSEPEFDIDSVFSILGTTLDDIHEDAERTVKDHIEKLKDSKAELWLSQGYEFGEHDSCPYCGQDTSDNDLIRAYKTHFNKAYSDLKEKVAGLTATINTATAKSVVDLFAEGVKVATTSAEGWKEHIETPPITFDAVAAETSLAQLRGMLDALRERKVTEMAEAVGSAEELERAKGLWQQVTSQMQSTNVVATAAMGAINTYKEHLQAESVPALQAQLDKLQATKKRYQPDVVDMLLKLNAARTALRVAEGAKKNERDKLDELMPKILAKYEQSINSLLKQFGAAFSIKGMGGNFRGKAPRSEYRLLLRGKDVALEGTGPSFATTLSEGDKRTLAFAFFVASTLADPKLSDRIVVVDDPMCSLDVNRRRHTQTVLAAMCTQSTQLILLAHDPYFLRDFRSELNAKDSSVPIVVFQLKFEANDYSNFGTIDIDEECESIYVRNHALLNRYLAGQENDRSKTLKAIRQMLEGYLHRRFPGLLPRSAMFGEILALIDSADSSAPLSHAKNLLNDLNDINGFVKKHSHDEGETGPALPTASEIKLYVEKALGVVYSSKGSDE